MAEDDKIRYSDIIQPDDSIEKLISQLGEFNKQYETMTNAIRAGADKVVHALKATSGATSEGRKSIDEAVAATTRLERAQKELQFASSETGKQVAWLKAQISDTNKATVEQQRHIHMAKTSYDKLQADLKETVSLFKALTKAEQDDAEMGQRLLEDLSRLANQIADTDLKLRQHIQAVTSVKKAEEELSAVQSGAKDRLLELKAQIKEATEERKKELGLIKEKAATTKEEADISQRLADAKAKLERIREEGLTTKEKEARDLRKVNKEIELQARIVDAEPGSYEKLSAQYELNIMLLNKMGKEERNSIETKQGLEAETKKLSDEMKLLNESVGNHRLSVGDYGKAITSLRQSTNLLIREMPAATVSANTFFLAISNNVPMFVDSIRRLKDENKAAVALGRDTKSIFRSIMSAVVSWQTLLVIGLTIFSAYGEEIIDWAKALFTGKKAVKSLNESLKDVNTEIQKNGDKYGKDIVQIKLLQAEWKRLKSLAEKKQWIKDNADEFKNLGIQVNTVKDAEAVLIEKTEAVITAFKLRAKAAAASKLAEEQYGKAIARRLEADEMQYTYEKDEKGNLVKKEKPVEATGWEKFLAYQQGSSATNSQYTSAPVDPQKLAEENRANQIKDIRDEANAIEQQADAYFDLANGFEAAAAAELKKAGVEEYHKKDKGGGGAKSQDLTKIINQNNIKLQKKYEESVTELLKDEYAKRRKAAADEVQNENNKLFEMYRLNEEYLKNIDGKYKSLTDKQKKQIKQQQDWITKTVANNLKILAIQVQQIQNEQKINSVQITKEATNKVTGAAGSDKLLATAGAEIITNPDKIENYLAQERWLLEKNLDLEYKLIISSNKKLIEAGDTQARSEEEILLELNNKKLKLQAEYDLKILKMRELSIKNQLKLVTKGTKEELKLTEELYKILGQIALTQNLLLPAEQQQSSTDITNQNTKQTNLAIGQIERTRFEQKQEKDAAEQKLKPTGARQQEVFELKQAIEDLTFTLKQADEGKIDLSPEERATIVAQREEKEKELGKKTGFSGFIGDVGKHGLGGALLGALGFDDEGIAAAEDAANQIIGFLQDIAAAEIEAAEKAVEAQEKKVEAAQSAYDAEIEARNNGYANNVATAKKELDQEKKKQQEKQKLLEEAQRKQELINTVLQTNSLITSSAQIWSAMSGVPIVGPALAIAAIAAMWASFAASKIKAKQVASATYGEGGLEFLEGGSHASGHDIDLNLRNSEGRNMRAEGGEAMAIINKRNAKKYRKVLPEIVNSLNKGVFEEKYLNAFNTGANVFMLGAGSEKEVDLSGVEDKLDAIKNQGATKYYTLQDGTIIMQYKNIKRIIKN